jgi:hypothetical protein
MPTVFPGPVKASLHELQSRFAITKMVQNVGEAVHAFVKAEWHFGPYLSGLLDQPVLMLRETSTPGYVKRIQHAGRSVSKVESTRAELGDITWEQPVFSLRGRTGEDGLGERVAYRFPSGGIRL